MNKTYELATTVFKAETTETQKLQHQLLKESIQKHLAKKEDQDIVEAINEAESRGKFGIAKLIDELTQESIDTIEIVDHTQNIRSDLFTLPIIIRSGTEQSNIVALQEFEKVIYEELLTEELIPEKAKVVLAPILLGSKTAKNMPESKWYELHNQIIQFSDKRMLRPIFSQDFFIKHQANYPEVYFLVGAVIQNNEPEKEAALVPSFLNGSFYIEKEKNKFIQSFQNKMQELMTGLELLSVSPNRIYTGVLTAFQIQQELLIEYFIDSYMDEKEIDFVILSLNVTDHFAIFAWNNQTNKIQNYLLVEPLGEEMQVNVDKVMGYFAQTDKVIYVGNSTISQEQMIDFKNFDFKNYLHEEGASVLQSEDADYISN